MLEAVKKVFVLSVFAAISWFIMKFQPGVFIGLIFLLFFLFYYAKDGYLLLVKLFDFPKKSFLSRFFGVLVVFWLLVVVVSFLLLFQLPIFYFGILTLPLTAILLEIFLVLSFRQSKISVEITEEPATQEIVMPSSTFFLAAVLLLIAGAFYILFKSQTSAEILTPWKILPEYYLYLYLLIYLVLGLLIFTNNHTKTLLVLFFIFSLLCHFNLAFTHKLVYGADYWRHLGSQSQILQTGKIIVQNFAENPNIFEKINFGLYSYSGFWGLNIILHLFTRINFIDLGKFAGPVLWSFFIPVLFYALGRVLTLSKRLALFLVWLSFIPNALLTVGSFSLPVSLYFIFWLFSLLLLLKTDLQKNKKQFWFLFIVGLLQLSGYLLYAVLFFLALILKIKNTYLKGNGWLTNVFWFIIFIFSSVALPAIEVISGYSQLSFKSDLFSALKQFVGNLTGYYFVSGPRPHTIATGNILINQTSDYAFVGNAFTTMPWWMLFISTLFIIGAIIGAYKFFKNELDNRWLVVFFGGLFGGYFISRYLLNGENILTRRLDAILALGITIFFAFWLKGYIFDQYNYKITTIIILILSIFGSAIYSLGPVSKVISVQEYLDYTDIATQLKDEVKYCVIADPYNLTVLEGVSAKKIIGGGFPIKGDFSQTELQTILSDWKEGRDKDQIIAEAKQITGAKNCFVVEKSNGNIKMEKY